MITLVMWDNTVVSRAVSTCFSVRCGKASMRCPNSLLFCIQIVCIWGAGGATPGKFLIGLRVVTCDSSVLVQPNKVLVVPATNVSLSAWVIDSQLLLAACVSFFSPNIISFFPSTDRWSEPWTRIFQLPSFSQPSSHFCSFNTTGLYMIWLLELLSSSAPESDDAEKYWLLRCCAGTVHCFCKTHLQILDTFFQVRTRRSQSLIQFSMNDFNSFKIGCYLSQTHPVFLYVLYVYMLLYVSVPVPYWCIFNEKIEATVFNPFIITNLPF